MHVILRRHIWRRENMTGLSGNESVLEELDSLSGNILRRRICRRGNMPGQSDNESALEELGSSSGNILRGYHGPHANVV